VLEELEEADFYMQQGLHDEAEALYRRVVAVVPNHPRALARLGARRDRAGRVGRTGPRRAAPGIDLDEERELTEPRRRGRSDEVDRGRFLRRRDRREAEPGRPARRWTTSRLDLDDADSAERAESDGSDTEELPRPAVNAAEHRSEAERDGDLAAALADAFDDGTGSGVRSALPSGDDGFAAVFSAFKKGVRETLSEGDHQAHYDLAIAYKEMGLHDDAIYELRTAMPTEPHRGMPAPDRPVRDRPTSRRSRSSTEQLLLLPISRGRGAAGRFDLGRALEAAATSTARGEWRRSRPESPDSRTCERG
jgi:tetratricopeptide (TPR) repeat protein